MWVELPMKKIITYLLIVLTISSCKSMFLRNLPTISSLHKLNYSNDSLFLDFKLDIPYKVLHKKLVYEFNPIVIINDFDTIVLDSKNIYGEKVKGLEPKVIYKYGGEFLHSDTISLKTKINKIRIIQKSRIKIYENDRGIFLPDNLIFEGKINQ